MLIRAALTGEDMVVLEQHNTYFILDNWNEETKVPPNVGVETHWAWVHISANKLRRMLNQ